MYIIYTKYKLYYGLIEFHIYVKYGTQKPYFIVFKIYYGCEFLFMLLYICNKELEPR